MWVCACFVWFVFYSILGWVYETTYCTINERRWENRGFLYGPLCPIYGTGVMLMMGLWYLLTSSGITLSDWEVFAIAFVGSAILEYTTHWTLEKLFHAYWWDYSNMPLNLHGRICLPASIAFGLAGLVVVNVLYEPTVNLTEEFYPPVIEVVALILMAIVASDTALTVSALTRFARAAASINDSVNAHMERFVNGVQERGAAVMEQVQERRDGAAQAIAGTVETIKDTGVTVTGQIQARGEAATDAIAHERDRFAEMLRDSVLGNMGHYVRAAVRRAKGITLARNEEETRETDALSSLFTYVRDRHWPRT